MKKHIAHVIVLVMFLLTVCSSLTACNTLNGMGQDLQGAGRAMENTF